MNFLNEYVSFSSFLRYQGSADVPIQQAVLEQTLSWPVFIRRGDNNGGNLFGVVVIKLIVSLQFGICCQL